MKYILAFWFIFLFQAVFAQSTHRRYLSGTGLNHTVMWDFYCSDGNNSRRWSKIEVPSQWELQGFGTYTYGRWYKEKGVKNPSMETGIYRHSFKVPKEYTGQTVQIVFDGVMTDTEVLVNDCVAGPIHQGGFYRFSYDITRLLNFGGKNRLEVRVSKHSANKSVNAAERKADWWLFGGIYRPVWLVVTEPYNISVTDCASPGVYITQKNVSKKQADVKVKVKLDNGTLQPAPVTLQNTIYDQEGKQVATHSQSFELSAQGEQAYESSFTIKKPTLWQGRENPYLYKVVSRLIKDGLVIDEMVQPLGLRKYEIVAGKGFYLNGEKYPMYGVTRHQDWWGLGSALKNENHDFDLATIMDVGATTVRFAHYQQSDYLYSRCDSLGLIIWAEIPFVNRVTGQEAENCRNQLREMIRQSFNHPSIYVWGLHNEVYQPHQYTKELTQSLHDLAKTEDPDRYTVSVNGYGHMEHPVNLVADIQGMNRYFGWYEKKIQDIKPWVENLEKEYPHQKLMLTEYGADANLNHQTEYLGDALNWTKEFYPETFATKTHEYQWSVIAAHPYIIASYLWNTFDFCAPMWVRGGVPARNMKGLVTFDRKIKKDSYFWYKANWSKEPVLYLTQRRNWDREKKETSVTVYSNIGTPKVYLNGKELTGIREGYTPVHYIIDNITLDMGKNIVKTVVVKNGKTYEDEIEWVYNGEKKRDSDQSVNKEEHAGF